MNSGFHLDTLENNERWIATALVPVSDFAALFQFTIGRASCACYLSLPIETDGARGEPTPTLEAPREPQDQVPLEVCRPSLALREGIHNFRSKTRSNVFIRWLTIGVK